LLWSERELPEHRATLDLYGAALKLRRTDEVLVESGRAELLAEVSGNVLMVHRWRGNERRVLVMNLGEEEVSLASLTEHLRLRGQRALLHSARDEKNTLSFGDAVVLAGEGNLAGLVEGAA
jgi:hypothetical protein